MPERRHSPRYPYVGSGTIRIFFPDQTLAPDPFDFKSLNLSHGGLFGIIQGLPNRVYLAILREKRFCEIAFALPGGGELKSYARIAWLDYNNMVKPTILRFGIEFAELTPANAQALEEALTRLQNENPTQV